MQLHAISPTKNAFLKKKKKKNKLDLIIKFYNIKILILISCMLLQLLQGFEKHNSETFLKNDQ